jgi:hypothetical protein
MAIEPDSGDYFIEQDEKAVEVDTDWFANI